MNAPERPLISVVAPAFNELDTLQAFYARLTAALADEEYELVIVDDGSTDGTGVLLDQMATADDRLSPLHLSRNFGHQAAVTAGIDYARGDVVITIDADLQDPPEVIPRLLERWRAGADVVHAVRHVRPGEGRLRLFAIRQFYALFTRLARLETFPGNAGDFRLIGGPALAALRALPERNRFVRGLVSWVGFNQESVVYEREARFAGRSKYPLRKLMHLASDGLVAFSTAPLRMAAVLGLLFSAGAFAAIPVVIVLRMLDLYHVSGIASVHILILLIGGIQLVFLGVIGEYLGRTYDEGKRRPIYLVAPTAVRREAERVHGG
jgi:polyisoprenyl-phosphate glycosyltransferase